MWSYSEPVSIRQGLLSVLKPCRSNRKIDFRDHRVRQVEAVSITAACLHGRLLEADGI